MKLFSIESIDNTTQIALERLNSMNLSKSKYSPAKALYMFGSRTIGTNRSDSNRDYTVYSKK